MLCRAGAGAGAGRHVRVAERQRSIQDHPTDTLVFTLHAEGIHCSAAAPAGAARDSQHPPRADPGATAQGRPCCSARRRHTPAARVAARAGRAPHPSAGRRRREEHNQLSSQPYLRHHFTPLKQAGSTCSTHVIPAKPAPPLPAQAPCRSPAMPRAPAARAAAQTGCGCTASAPPPNCPP